MAVTYPSNMELKDLNEEMLWEMIERHRHEIVQKIHSSRLTSYLRQAKVLSELDEEEILHSLKLTNRVMKAGYMLDLLRMRGKNGALAFLESLKLHKPDLYTLITGKEPTVQLANVSNFIETSQLTEYLIRAITGMQMELTEERSIRGCLQTHYRHLQEKFQDLERKNTELKNMEEEYNKQRKYFSSLYHDLQKVKDESYQLSMRYTSTLQEKDLAATRCRELQEELYNLKFELKLTKSDLQSCKSVKAKVYEEEIVKLKEEVETLTRLIFGGGGKQVKKDILEHDLGEALEGRQELISRMSSLREKAEIAESLRDTYLEEKESLLMECQRLKMESHLYMEKINALQAQLTELKKERDQAYAARDEAQLQISQSLAEKDLLRQQMFEQSDWNFKLRTELMKLKAEKTKSKDDNSKETLLRRGKPKLRRMKAICPGNLTSDSDCSFSSEEISPLQDYSLKRNESFEMVSSFKSCTAEPPSKDSLYQRKVDTFQEIMSLGTGLSIRGGEQDLNKGAASVCDFTDCGLALFLSAPESDASELSIPTGEEKEGEISVLLPRRDAQRSPNRVTTVAFQGDSLLEQVEIIGGNTTGIFIHRVRPGSPANEVCLSAGTQILEVDYNMIEHHCRAFLEDSTLEEAIWSLKQVEGFCCLSVRINMGAQLGYQTLVSHLEKKLVTSGDSFYIRANLKLEEDSRLGMPSIQCNDILHVTDTVFKGKEEWKASRVDPYNKADLDYRTIPNYYHAQELLIATIQGMTQQTPPSKKMLCKPSSEQRKVVRIVSTDKSRTNPLWSSFDGGTVDTEKSKESSVKSCFTLMPYTLVKPYKPAFLRPVIITPSLISTIVIAKLSNQNFMKCEPECLTGTEFVERTKNGDILGEKPGKDFHLCITQQAVQAVAEKEKYCLLKDKLHCVCTVKQSPVLLHSQTLAAGFRKALNKVGASDNLLLDCSRREQVLLDRLPCLHRNIAPESWRDVDSLVGCIKAAVTDEQQKIVWMEQDPR
uniref:Caspase recruitment domain family member 14 n=1 Tax=Latimeria chalumnae TaxID=7897 RepID=H3BE60_LATCH